jgi:hypothetical protein
MCLTMSATPLSGAIALVLPSESEGFGHPRSKPRRAACRHRDEREPAPQLLDGGGISLPRRRVGVRRRDAISRRISRAAAGSPRARSPGRGTELDLEARAALDTFVEAAA